MLPTPISEYSYVFWIMEGLFSFFPTALSLLGTKCTGCVLCLVTQSCLTLCDPMDCSLPGSSVHRDSPGKNTEMGCYALLQGIFPTQGLNPGLLHCRWILYHLNHQESPRTKCTGKAIRKKNSSFGPSAFVATLLRNTHMDSISLRSSSVPYANEI